MRIEEIRGQLQELADESNARRSSSITPNARPILGARIPDLRRMAKQIAKEDYRAFLEQCPDDLLEWQILHAFVLGYAKDDVETILGYADRFIPKIGDGCVNDSFCQSFRIARQHRARVWDWLMQYAQKEKEYPQRVVAVMLLSHFLVEEYIGKVLEVTERLTCDAYYTKMGVAWCVATAYAKFPAETYSYLQKKRLKEWTFRKAIQKITESFRVSAEDKALLRTMKSSGAEAKKNRIQS